MAKHGTRVVKRVRVFTPEEFQEQVCRLREPAILCGLDLGCAPAKWSPEYLKSKHSKNAVKIHVCPQQQMDFVNRNFAYKTLSFGELVQRCSQKWNSEHFICKEECYYLRAIASGDPRKDIANFSQDYPELAPDLRLPLLFPQDKYFSSVLRMGSAGIQLWTHYDVMDNLLVQVVGKKRVVLFPPSDAPNLYLVGDKSRVMDIDDPDYTTFPKFSEVRRYEAVLEPTEVLFIPSLWFHNVRALEFGVAVNVFWRHLEEEFYDGRDTYGNKDPPQVQRSLQVVERAVKMLSDLPEEYREFYKYRLLGHIEEKMT